METPQQVSRPPEKPWVIWDGECGFCAFSVGVLKERLGPGKVDCARFQDLKGRFPEIPRENFAQAVHLVEPDGSVSQGAKAVFRALDYQRGGCRFWRLYGRSGFFRGVSEWGYRRVARNRELAARVARLIAGGELYEARKASARGS